MMTTHKLLNANNRYDIADLVDSAIRGGAEPLSIVALVCELLTLYDSIGAADYLGISINTLAYHLWQQQDISRRLVPDLRVGKGRVFLFTKMTLDDWDATRRKAHWVPDK